MMTKLLFGLSLMTFVCSMAHAQTMSLNKG